MRFETTFSAAGSNSSMFWRVDSGGTSLCRVGFAAWGISDPGAAGSTAPRCFSKIAH